MTETKTLTLTTDQFDQLDRVLMTRVERSTHPLREAFVTAGLCRGTAHLWGLTDNDLKTLWAFSLRLGNAPLSSAIRRAIHPNVFHTGDAVSVNVDSTVYHGHVVKAAGQTQLYVVEAETRSRLKFTRRETGRFVLAGADHTKAPTLRHA